MKAVLFFTSQFLIASVILITNSHGVFVKGRRRPFEQQLRAKTTPNQQPRALLNHHNDRQKVSSDRNSKVNSNNNADLSNAEDPGTFAAEDLSPGLGLPFDSFNSSKIPNDILATAKPNSTIYEDFSSTPLMFSFGVNNNNINRPMPPEPLHILRAELVQVDEQVQQLRSRDNNYGKMFQLLQLLNKREELQDKIAIKMQANGASLAENA